MAKIDRGTFIEYDIGDVIESSFGRRYVILSKNQQGRTTGVLATDGRDHYRGTGWDLQDSRLTIDIGVP